MIFWIVIAIMVVGFALFALNIMTTSDEEQYEKLKAEYDRYSDSYRWLPFDWGAGPRDEMYIQYREKEKAALRALNEFKQAHPKLEASIKRREKAANVFATIWITAAVIAVIMLLIIVISALSAPVTRAALEAEYETLQYEFDHNVYTDNGDDVVGKKELYNQIREYNVKLTKQKAKEQNFWYGIFVPDIYGDLPLVNLN